MRKANHTSKFATLEDHGTLADSELDAVAGGAFPIVMAQMALAKHDGAAGGTVTAGWDLAYGKQV